MRREDDLIYQQFKLVFIQYYSSLCNYAYTFTQDSHDSEDIVQEIFLRIWDKKQDLVSHESIRYYLFTAVRNNSLSFIQNKKRAIYMQPQELMSGPEMLPSEKQEDGIPDEITLINKGVGLLPPKCREVFLLSRIGKLSYKEIAQSLKISVKTVENQIGKAIRILRDFIKSQNLPLIFMALNFIYQLLRSSMGEIDKMLSL